MDEWGFIQVARRNGVLLGSHIFNELMLGAAFKTGTHFFQTLAVITKH